MLEEYIRILRLSKKPDRKEYIKMLKVTLLGILILGVLGYIIQLIAYLLITGGIL